MSILIKNGRVVTAVDDYFADVLVEGEIVTQIGKKLDVQADTVIDASGKLVIPGGIDPHTHLDMPFGGSFTADDFASGTTAAAAGGTTTIIDFAIQTQGKSALEGLDAWHAKAEGKATIDYSFHMIITDMPEERLPEMEKLAQGGVTSYKMFMAYPGVLYADDATHYRTYKAAADGGTRIMLHAENGIVIDEIIKAAVKDGKVEPKWHALTRPSRLAGEAVHRAAAIAEVAGAPLYIVHLDCNDSLVEVVRARKRGLDISAETCPQYLFLDHSHYEQEGFEGAKYVMSPPLRDKSHQAPLWKGLFDGDLASVATDHAPFNMEGQKELGREVFTKIPNGAPGVENRMAIMYDGAVVKRGMSLNRFVDITSTAAAKIFGMFPKKGTIAVGSDADICIFDPERKETISVDNPTTHHMRVDYSAFEGFEVQGYPETVLSRGRVILERNQVKTTGGGQFIKRARVGELLR